MIRDPEVLQTFLARCRTLVRERLIPHEARINDDDAIPREIIAELSALGLFGLSIPREWGGLGLTMEEEVLTMFELGRASPAYRSYFAINQGGGSRVILLDGTDAQRREYLPKLASGEIVGTFAITEPEAGSDAASLTTTAIRDGGDYVLNGVKSYIANAPEASVITVLARTDPASKGAASVSAFILDMPRAGAKVIVSDKKLGMYGAHYGDLVLEDCRVPAAALVGGVEGNGFKSAMRTIDKARLHVAAVCVGAAERLIDEALIYAHRRKQFGRAIAEFQMIQAMLADSRAECYAARSMTLDAARKRDEGGDEADVTMEVACCKLFASEMVGRVADRALQIHGASGYFGDAAVLRFYRDVRAMRIYDGTSEVQRLVIAREMAKNSLPLTRRQAQPGLRPSARGEG
jgi:acyl-CoA dehydrogenase